MRRLKFIPALALSSALITVGCAVPQTAQVATTAPGGAIGFFDQVNGLGAVDIRVIDKRMSTQAYADVAPFHKVKFEIRNATKLKAARQSEDLEKSSTGVYSQAFTRLPSDTDANYELSAALYGSLFSVATLPIPDFKVGEGVSAKFSLQPGERKTITVVINAVGEFEFESDDTEVNSYSIDPTFVAGDTTAKALISLDGEKNPLARSVKYGVGRFVDGELQGFTSNEALTIAKQDWNTSGPTAMAFELPELPDPAESETFFLLVGMFDENENMLSIRSRQFVVEPGASVDVDVNDPAPVVNFDYTATLAGTDGALTVNGTLTNQFNFESFMMPPVYGGVLKVVNTTAFHIVVDDIHSSSMTTVAPGATAYFNMHAVWDFDPIMMIHDWYFGGVTFSVPQG
jgi:hypothetical protein